MLKFTGALTESLIPSKCRDFVLENFMKLGTFVLHVGPFTSVPLYPLPELSFAILDPVPSSSFQYATGAGFPIVRFCTVLLPKFNVAFVARAPSVIPVLVVIVPAFAIKEPVTVSPLVPSVIVPNTFAFVVLMRAPGVNVLLPHTYNCFPAATCNTLLASTL